MSEATIIEEKLVLRTSGAQRPAVDSCVAAPTSLVAVSVRHLIKQYADGKRANIGIDLDVRRGEVISILGPNGAGKTTFLRQLTTELRPTAGTIKIFDVDAVAQPDKAKKLMGITPQESGVFETLTVRQHLELFGQLKGLTAVEARQQTRELIVGLGLSAEEKKRAGLLSGGQRRRILIALALLGKPPLLVLDEPTTGLDPASRREVWRSIKMAVGGGATVILSTHYLEEAEALSDRIAVISEGKLIALGSHDELLSRLEKSYRLSYRDPLDHFAGLVVRLFATFAAAQSYVEYERLSEYSISRVSLEDVYFMLTGTLLTGDQESIDSAGGCL